MINKGNIKLHMINEVGNKGIEKVNIFGVVDTMHYGLRPIESVQ